MWVKNIKAPYNLKKLSYIKDEKEWYNNIESKSI